jgi:hypothetical protein
MSAREIHRAALEKKMHIVAPPEPDHGTITGRSWV